MRLHILQFSLIKRPILKPQSILKFLNNFSLRKPAHKLLPSYFKNPISLRFIIDPLPIIIQRPLISAASMFHPLSKLPNIDVLANHQLAIPIV